MKLIPLILNELSEKVIQQLIEKFSKQTSLNPQGIRKYIERFKQIQNSPNVKKKDPFEYTWKEFEQVVDANRKKDIKAGKIDPTAEDANKVYDKNNLRVYVGKTKEACIKYGNGYSFCISARGEDNLYASYRLEFFLEDWYNLIFNTPYFIFNDSLSSEQKPNEDFVDPDHLLVIFIGIKPGIIKDREFYLQLNRPEEIKYLQDINGVSFTVTDANNTGERYFESFSEMVYDYPWVKVLEDVIKPVPPTKEEVEEAKIEKEFRDKFLDEGLNLRIYLEENTPISNHTIDELMYYLPNEIERLLSNESEFKKVIDGLSQGKLKVYGLKISAYTGDDEDIRMKRIALGDISKAVQRLERAMKDMANIKYHTIGKVEWQDMSGMFNGYRVPFMNYFQPVLLSRMRTNSKINKLKLLGSN
jgi:hypothetical protein